MQDLIGMTDARWTALSNDHTLQLTKAEKAIGWHWCPDWDGMLVGPGMDEMSYCECGSIAICTARTDQLKQSIDAARHRLQGKSQGELNQLGLNRYRTNENKEPLPISTGLTEMTEPKTCSTCHWWFRFDDDKNILWGRCVWHNGVKTTTVQQLRGRGTIETRDDFGCIKHEEDKRE